MGAAGEVPGAKGSNAEGSAMEGAQRWQTVEAAVAGGEPEGTGTGGRSMRSRASWEAKSSAWLKAMMGGWPGEGEKATGTRRLQ